MQIGITERGDAGRDMSWQFKMNGIAGAVLITKNIDSSEFQQAAARYANKVIVHATITGFGSTCIEPNVSDYRTTLKALSEFVQIFPAKQVVLRIDPIIPTEKGLRLVYEILSSAPAEIKRVRFSFIDNYKHLRERGMILPWPSFHAPHAQQQAGVDLLRSFEQSKGLKIESCGEDSPLIPLAWKIGCISKLDCDILGIEVNTTTTAGQRKACRCLSVKTELLSSKNPCPNNCSYCYWR